MKSQFKILLILLTVIFSLFNAAYRIVPDAKATYVEGAITTDTCWTLVDSPFVLSNNVTINQGTTLTIEPGVEVRFGGDFELAVLGAITAIGTKDRTIHFTTNNPTLNSTWRTIMFNGTHPSSFANCAVEYGKNAIVVEGGSLEIEDSFVGHNSENGITINNGTLYVRNSEIANNTISGIHMVGGDQTIVENSTIRSNGDGITLSGNLTGTTRIEQNNVLSNAQSGIVLESDSYGSTVITKNNVSSNSNGFLVSTNTSTTINGNYIFNNTIGVYYQAGNEHEAHFNDIYDNTESGMDGTSTITANATRNYWGHPSGPKHVTLNPHGKGNNVGGDGANIDFIFFLTKSSDYASENNSPKAVLWTDKVLATRDQNVTLVGTDSYDEDGRVDEYFFDFGDGTNSGWTTLTVLFHNYTIAQAYPASLRVRDDFGSESETVYATIEATDLAPPQVQVTLGNFTIDYDQETLVTVTVSNGVSEIPNANVRLLSIRGGNFAPVSGLTDANGVLTAKFTAPSVKEVTSIRIIARVSINGYADGSGNEYLKVLPPPIVKISVDPQVIKSEEMAIIKALVLNNFEEPIANAILTLFSTNGTLPVTVGTTDLYGLATFTFIAPLTLTQLNTTITAIVNMIDFAEEQSQAYVIVEPKALSLTVTANPTLIVSGGNSTITAQTTYEGAPFANATVTVSSNIGGELIPTTAITDQEGIAAFVFATPQASTIYANATITARAYGSGYVDGENSTIVSIEPRVLSVQIVAEPDITYSSSKVNVTVRVTHNEQSIEDATVTVTAESGNFAIAEGVTDSHGEAIFTFTTPQVNEPTNVSITALAFKDGYVENVGLLQIGVVPRTFNLQIIVPTIKAGVEGSVIIHVTCVEDGTAVNEANIALSYGNSYVTNATDPTGTCTFVLGASQTAGQSLNMTIDVTRTEYSEAQRQITVPIVQPEGGSLIITIVLIAIPIMIAVIVAVLIKLKIIVVSSAET